MKKIGLLFDTRPDAIKMAPVTLTIKESKDFEPFIIASAQHAGLQMFDKYQPFPEELNRVFIDA